MGSGAAQNSLPGTPAPSGGRRTVLAHLSSADIGADRGQDARLRCINSKRERPRHAALSSQTTVAVHWAHMEPPALVVHPAMSSTTSTGLGRRRRHARLRPAASCPAAGSCRRDSSSERRCAASAARRASRRAVSSLKPDDRAIIPSRDVASRVDSRAETKSLQIGDSCAWPESNLRDVPPSLRGSFLGGAGRRAERLEIRGQTREAALAASLGCHSVQQIPYEKLRQIRDCDRCAPWVGPR
jgi:hypothetical protein